MEKKEKAVMVNDVLEIMYKHKCSDGSQRTDKMKRKVDKSLGEVLAETIDNIELLRKPCGKCSDVSQEEAPGY